MLIYLPPYSPHFNPIEAYFGDTKKLLRRRYRQFGADAQDKAQFKECLRQVAEERGNKVDAIQGHYRQAQVPIRESGNEVVDYELLYYEQKAELLNLWIAQGFVE